MCRKLVCWLNLCERKFIREKQFCLRPSCVKVTKTYIKTFWSIVFIWTCNFFRFSSQFFTLLFLFFWFCWIALLLSIAESSCIYRCCIVWTMGCKNVYLKSVVFILSVNVNRSVCDDVRVLNALIFRFRCLFLLCLSSACKSLYAVHLANYMLSHIKCIHNFLVFRKKKNLSKSFRFVLFLSRSSYLFLYPFAFVSSHMALNLYLNFEMFADFVCRSCLRLIFIRFVIKFGPWNQQQAQYFAIALNEINENII